MQRKKEPLDRVVEVYVQLRADGATCEEAWRFGCMIARNIDLLSFEYDVQQDLASLPVVEVL